MRVNTHENGADPQQTYDLEDARKRLSLIAEAVRAEQLANEKVATLRAQLRAAIREAQEARWRVATVTHRVAGGGK